MSNVAYTSEELLEEEQYAAEQQLPTEFAQDFPVDPSHYGDVADDAALERARPVPRISIQAFCEDANTAGAIQLASQDRRLSKVHLTVNMGGIPGAIANYQDAPTPNLIVVEALGQRDQTLAELDALSEYCDAGTKVIVIGRLNDVILYRELLRRGVSEYVIAPVTPLALMESISNLYNDPDADPVGHVFAFVGAKGGSGSSTVCHNVAWALSEALKSEVIIADLDLAFGTAGLDFNQDPVQGIADALGQPDRLDEVLLDRLLAGCTENLNLLAAPGLLDRDYDISPEAYEWVIDVARQNVPYLALDLPHVWTPWAKQQLVTADEVVITAVPDLANLRNAKNIVDLLKEVRTNDRPPHLIINQVGLPKRPEIPVKEFADALGLEPRLVIGFNAETFGMAANNGQMIGEVDEKAQAAEQFRELALRLANRLDYKKSESKSLLAPFLAKFSSKKTGA